MDDQYFSQICLDFSCKASVTSVNTEKWGILHLNQEFTLDLDVT